ncbi:YbjQ family protein [Fusibacter paucivorans]|uniref:UPF0145 protein KHM83_11405 n=1 Tax=Fusibacter paucivorans TaxID=76009 RepID=A0ABS5PQ44_9FIRM|nr:YbjQ family protein [Fusibacter paucivorans]MBS7527288.1 YbjQ family protein [Fusibacter paucivorans]
MLLVTTPDVPGKKIVETLGIAKGCTIRAKHIGKDITSIFRQLVGGEMKEYSEMLQEARQIATKNMVAEAEALGANAIVNIRYASSSVMQGAAEVLAYGTAVIIE